MVEPLPRHKYKYYIVRNNTEFIFDGYQEFRSKYLGRELRLSPGGTRIVSAVGIPMRSSKLPPDLYLTYIDLNKASWSDIELKESERGGYSITIYSRHNVKSKEYDDTDINLMLKEGEQIDVGHRSKKYFRIYIEEKEKAERIIKALKHLIRLSGGNAIEELF